MSAKAIYESCGKQIMRNNLKVNNGLDVSLNSAVYDSSTSWDNLLQSNPWLKTSKLVVKPDQLIKRRGKLGLIKVDVDHKEVKKWIDSHMNKVVMVGAATGKLKRFIIEPFIPHSQKEEYYLCIYSARENDVILFHHEGGVDVGDVDAKALKLKIPINRDLKDEDVSNILLVNAQPQNRNSLIEFIRCLYKLYVDLHFTYLEINPLVVKQEKVYVLDLAAKLDQCADYLCNRLWGEVQFPPPFGREAYPEEAYIADLDAKSGASLKLTILNPHGKIWCMVAGGGASVIYADTICEMGGAKELANYGEYSGAPTEQQTYDYAKTILQLMCRDPKPENPDKILIIGGGIANFTNVASTFKGIVRALRDYQMKLIACRASIFVRRAGPNYQEGLRIMRELGSTLGVPIHVFGPETHMTAIVGMALGKINISAPAKLQKTTAKFLLPTNNAHDSKSSSGSISSANEPSSIEDSTPLFSAKTKAIVWGMQNRAIQGMLDFDYVCSRKTPSVVAILYPLVGNHKQKFYWGHTEILIPVYKKAEEVVKNHPDADILVNFASLRSAYESTVEMMQFEQIRCIAIIAEGIPENLTRKLIEMAKEKNVQIIGPATVGGIKPGCFKIGNTGGMLDNILSSKLFRSGSVAYVSRSGGMSNELNNIIALNTDGVYEGVAIGGDRYPGTTFLDHVLRYEDNPDVKMIVVLGEVGGTEEYRIIDAIKSGKVQKPIVAWCIGTCASMFTSEVQFGHAGSCATLEKETAESKNEALKQAGVYVPSSFDDLDKIIKSVYDGLVKSGVLVPAPEVVPPTVPMDYNWARELGLIRKPASFMTSICDERGQELLYAGVPITEVFKENLGIGGVLSLLWFQKRLPKYALKFIEMCLMVTADHGPAVSGAHNTIVCARAGKDLVSSLASGLLTIGDRFGGALDGAAKEFSEGFDTGLSPMEFVNHMKKQGKLIMGIGHRVKSINNPDMRVVILKNFVKEHFPATPLLDYALEVEKVTTSKKPNLILNVDGLIGVAMVDLLRSSGCFTYEEACEYIEIGALNGLFVLGRSIGFIGHFLDQKRLKQGLYRHPWDDISYIIPEKFTGN
ncbi:hypothetical protein HELRODRAFT_155589 [Helobdella robusta]|uniref:ATP-citrate synthase n=1 Tax=Helobdella robusta TaxID=6412 RepID=T1ELJ3_HELRO|nr:hypothetical protein HELRODRAFT_155589 [Helobdella robusta]ESO12632.1 hypothetical protein HELRODRAFT_155589 [Helobdella robusta]